MSRRDSTILPPPPAFPAPMPAVRAPEENTGEWLALVEMTVATIRPGKLASSK